MTSNPRQSRQYEWRLTPVLCLTTDSLEDLHTYKWSGKHDESRAMHALVDYFLLLVRTPIVRSLGHSDPSLVMF